MSQNAIDAEQNDVNWRGDDGFKLSIEDVTSRYEFLLREMEQFAAAFKSASQGETADVVGGLNKQLISPIRKDLESIKSLAKEPNDDASLRARRSHHLRSCNIPFDEALWSLAKHSVSIVAFRRRFPINHAETTKRAQRSGVVDIVASGGLQWIKICTTSERRMMFDMAKLGWSADSDIEDIEEDHAFESDDEEDIPILKHAKDLSRAASSSRVDGRHPRVRVVFTRMAEGTVGQFDKVFNAIRALPYVGVEFIKDLDPRAPLVESVISKMVEDPLESITNPLNLDCTALLSLVSDLSHARVTERVWHQTQTKRQMENEIEEPILVKWLYPVLCGRALVCTELCCEQFWKIVREIGTDTEKARGAALFGHATKRYEQDDYPLEFFSNKEEVNSRADLVEIWRKLSNHDVPSNLHLPVTVRESITSDPKFMQATHISRKILSALLETLSPLNASIFLTGWHEGLTTVTSNIIVVNKIKDALDRYLATDEEIEGPKIWCRAPPRSLLAKEKQSVVGIECPSQDRAKRHE